MARKKRGTKLLLLALTLVLLSGGALLAAKLSPEEEVTETVEEETTVDSEIVLAISGDTVDSIQWSYNGEELAFHRQDETWYLTADESFPVEQSFFSNMLSHFADLESFGKVENPADLAEFGLSEPLITASISGEQSATIEVGSAAPMDSLRYVSIGDGSVYMVATSVFSDFAYSLDQLLDTEELPTVSDFRSISLQSADLDLSFSYVAPAEGTEETADVWFRGETAVDAQLVEALYNSISSLSWLDCSSYNADEAQLSAYGFDAPTLTATVSYSDDNGDQSYTLELAESDSAVYAHLSGSSMVYTIDPSLAANIRSAAEALK